MFFLIIYIYCFILFAILFMVQETSETQTKNYFLEDDEDDEEDELNDDTKYEKDKYEDKYKINKEIMDDELSQEKLEGLCNSFILENTPNGNVLILYNHKTYSFNYYSDNSIPYKYLNTLARKYVNTYRCKQLYINSEDELDKEKESENKDKESENKEKESENKDKESENKDKESEKEPENKEKEQDQDTKKDKKQIFAKFKTYNKNTTNKIQQQPSQQQQQPSQQEVIANRYTYQGKIANFNFLKKPDKKLVNKKLSLTFSDYKKLNISI